MHLPSSHPNEHTPCWHASSCCNSTAVWMHALCAITMACVITHCASLSDCHMCLCPHRRGRQAGIHTLYIPCTHIFMSFSTETCQGGSDRNKYRLLMTDKTQSHRSSPGRLRMQPAVCRPASVHACSCARCSNMHTACQPVIFCSRLHA